MAKYIVEETKTSKYEKNFKFPLINLIPAIVWCIPVHQKLSPLAGTMGAFIAVAAFFMLYILLSYVPIAALAPGGGKRYHDDCDALGTGRPYWK